MHIMKVVMKFPQTQRASLVTERITLDYRDEYRPCELCFTSYKRFPCFFFFKEIYWMSKGNGKCDKRRWAQMNVYIPENNNHYQWVNNINNDVSYWQKGLICFRIPRWGPVKAACWCYTAAGRHFWLKTSRQIMKSTSSGSQFAIKGFVPMPESRWYYPQCFATLSLHLIFLQSKTFNSWHPTAATEELVSGSCWGYAWCLSVSFF